MSAALKDLPLRIRRMRVEDVAAVSALEQSAYEFPWTIGIFRDCLLAGYSAIALEQGGQLVGYAIMSVAAGEAHLLNICIAPKLRGLGVGRSLLDHMMDLAGSLGAERVFLEVRPSNSEALKLYRRAEFDVVGVRRAYYRAHNGKEDAVVLVRRLVDASLAR